MEESSRPSPWRRARDEPKMKVLWFGFVITAVAALIFCVTIIFLIRVFFWFLSDTFKRAESDDDDIEDRWWRAIK